MSDKETSQKKSTEGTTLKIVMAALLAALTCIATMIFSMPIPGGAGYVNFGDCFVITCGILVGGPYGIAAAGIGSALADLFSGFALYAPVTFVIKSLMALVVFLIFRALNKRKPKGFIVWIVISAVAAELVMVGGYFLFELILYGIGTAGIDVLPNLMQAAFGVVAGTIVGSLLHKLYAKLTGK